MKIRALDADNDWTFGKSLFKRDNNAVAQSIKTKLQSWRGDCYFDLTAGVDWSNILGSKIKQLAIADIKRVIAQVTGVLTIDVDFDTIDNRNLTVSYTVTTIYNDIITDEVQIA
jgi:hypothetical protein